MEDLTRKTQNPEFSKIATTSDKDLPIKANGQEKSTKTQEIEKWLIAYLAKELQIQPEKVDITVPWENYGLDSSTAVVLSGELQDWLGCELDPEILFEYQTIESLVEYLTQEANVTAPPSTETQSDRKQEIQAWLVVYLAKELQIQPEKIDITVPWENYGLDSSTAVVLSGELQDWLGCELDPEILFEYQTIESLVEYLTQEANVTAPPSTETQSDRKQEIQAWLVVYLAKELQIQPEKVDITVPWENYGLDSSTAVVLSGELQDWLGCELDPEILFEYQTIEALVDYLAQTIKIAPSPTETKPEKLDIVHLSESNIYPLSYNQRSLWFLTKLAPQSPAYNVAFSARIRSKIDIPALRRACQKLLDRHPLLRTIFTEQNGEPIQEIQDRQEICFDRFDASGLSEDELESNVTKAHQRPFDLERGPLFRASLFQRSEKDFVLLLTIHHIACDGWSVWMIIDELRHLYPAEKNGSNAPLPPLEFSYQDYVRWQKKMLESAEGEKLWQYWQKQLSGELPILNLPTDRPRPPVQNYRGASHTFKLTKELTQQLKQLAQAENASLYMTLLAAFQVLLHRYTGQEEILVGSPMKCRNKTEFVKIFGYLVNPVVLRGDLSKNPTFKDFLHQVRHTVSEAIAHQNYPFPLLVDRLHPERDSSRLPLFQVLFVLQKPQQSEDIVELFALGQPGIKVKLGDLELEPFVIPQQEGQFDLTLETIETKESISGVFKYNTDLFEAATIARLEKHFQTLLAAIVANPQQPVDRLSLLSAEERQQLLVEWNETASDYPQNKCINVLFEEWVERTPDAVAVVFKEISLTYRELNDRANQLAHYLQSLGVKPEVLVGISADRSIERIVGLLGILKAGGAYVPLDPAYPPERLAYMLSDSQVSLLLKTEDLLPKLPKYEGKIVFLDRDWQIIERSSKENPVSGAKAENLAYIIYTSGSTGKPKGVLIEHRGLCNLAKAQIEAFGVEASSRVLQFASFSFDASISEIVMTLCAGAQLHLATAESSLPGENLTQLLADRAITHITLPPSALAVMEPERLSTLKSLIVAGEACSAELVGRYAPGRRFFNAYGPTEITVCATIGECSDNLSKPSIGRPIANTEIYILDSNLQPVPIGVPGEMYIGGVGIARGYLNRPDLTQEKFITNPFNNPKSKTAAHGAKQGAAQNPKLYKTGDLVRYLPDGNIDFLGRIDTQVKIRGFRIELGEIEALLATHPEVREVAVIAREDKPGSKRLVAYIVSKLTLDRIPYETTCLAEFGRNTVELTTEDISEKGIGLERVPEDWYRGANVRLKLLLPGEEKERWLTGKIAWLKEERAGIEFNLNQEESKQLHISLQYLLETKGFSKVWQRTITQSLRNYLKERLPEYMVPSAFVLLETLPLTPNGKIDRKALPAPDLVNLVGEGRFSPPRNSTEKLLAKIWAEVLGLEKIGIYDNFFELGGDSILSIQIVARASREGINLTPQQIFQHQTIASLATVATASVSLVAQQGLVTGAVPLTPIQHWFFEQNRPEQHHYNQSLLLEVQPDIKPELVEKVVQELLLHHDSLRLRFHKDKTGWQQINAGSIDTIPFSTIDLSGMNAQAQKVTLETTAAQLQASLNLESGPIVRVALFKLGSDSPSRLLLVIHHLAVDGVSWRILLEDLATAYQQLDLRQTIQLPAKTTAFQDWSLRLQDYARSPKLRSEITYWLESCPAKIASLPVDYPSDKNANTEATAAKVSINLSIEETRALLQEVPSAYNTQINDVLLTALVQSLAQWTGRKAFLVDLEGHGREELFAEVNLSRTVGWFTTVFPVLLDLGAREELGKKLISIKEQLRQIPKKGINSGILRYLTQNELIRARLESLPQAEISFNYLGQFDRSIAAPPLLGFAKESVGGMYSPLAQRCHLIEINSSISEGILQVEWTYSDRIHRKETIEKIANSFKESLQALITHCQLIKERIYTPSDFPLAKLSDRQLQRILTLNPECEDIYSLAPTQQDMLFDQFGDPTSRVYLIQCIFNIDGKLNRSAWTKAWERVIARHQILRTSFFWQDLDQPVQIVQRNFELPWHELDWRSLSLTQQQEDLQKFLQTDRARGIELDRAPLMRCTLIQLSDDTYHFIWSHHHLIVDGWSFPIILGEVFSIYKASNKGSEPNLAVPIPFKNYISWLQQQDLSQAENFWRRSLQNFTAPLSFEINPNKHDKFHQEKILRLSPSLNSALQNLAQKHRLTLNTLLQGAWALLLYLHYDRDDIVFGTVVSGRSCGLAGVESMVGVFSNTMPVRVRISPETALLPWLQAIQSQQVEREKYAYTSSLQIQQWSALPPEMSLFENLMVLENYPLDEIELLEQVDLQIANIGIIEPPKLFLELIGLPGQQLSLEIDYYSRAFEAETIERMIINLQALLERMASNPEQRLAQLLLLTKKEQN
jgi:amino acid adenylation domain-containing protein/non-ribosomal peptide synthase protein (TIGR01720 family)